jgi:hypothetical protein
MESKELQAYADLIRAFASLLWPILAIAFVLVFRTQIGGLLVRLSAIKKGEFFGQKMEFTDTLDQDLSSKILTDYLNPGGKFDAERTRELNRYLRELSVDLDVRVILDGSKTAPLRQQLINYAKQKGAKFKDASAGET